MRREVRIFEGYVVYNDVVVDTVSNIESGKYTADIEEGLVVWATYLEDAEITAGFYGDVSLEVPQMAIDRFITRNTDDLVSSYTRYMKGPTLEVEKGFKMNIYRGNKRIHSFFVSERFGRKYKAFLEE